MKPIKELLKRAVGQSGSLSPKHRKDDWDGIPELMKGTITGDMFLQRNGITKIEDVLKEGLTAAYDQKDAAIITPPANPNIASMILLFTFLNKNTRRTLLV